MKKRVFFYCQDMVICGVNKSLINILTLFDYDKYDVYLFINSHEGTLLETIPPKVKRLPSIKKYSALKESLFNTLRFGYIDMFLIKLVARIIHFAKKKDATDKRQNYSQDSFIYHYITSKLPQITPEITYDLAISFLAPHNIVKRNIKAHYNIAWIHTDYSCIKINNRLELKAWKYYNYIIALSSPILMNFKECFPELINHKFEIIDNIVLYDEIIQQSNQQIDLDMNIIKDKIMLCSLGGITYAKGFDTALDIFANVIKKKTNVVWIIIGSGEDEKKIRKKIKYLNLDDFVFLVGQTINPYPYIKLCDIYFHPSRFEGSSIAVKEAKIFNKTIVLADFPTAKEHIFDYPFGFVIPSDKKEGGDMLYEIICNSKAIKNETPIVTNISNTLKKIYKFIPEGSN